MLHHYHSIVLYYDFSGMYIKHKVPCDTRKYIKVVFCQLAGIGAPERLEAIRRYICAWDSLTPLGAPVEENELIRAMVRKESEEKQSLADQLAQLSIRVAVVKNLEASLQATELRLVEVSATSGARDEKIDELRAEKAKTSFQLKEAQGKLEQLGEARDYVDRMSNNLAYVAMTRAMDHLNVFTLKKPESVAISNLVRAFGEDRKL